VNGSIHANSTLDYAINLPHRGAMQHEISWQEATSVAMPAANRIFVDAITKFCAGHGIACEARSQGWLIVMERDGTHRFALGYDLGLNSAISHRIAGDKAATSDILAMSGIPHIAHTQFSNPVLADYIPASGLHEAMRVLLRQHAQGVVVKPNEGTSGRLVFKVTNEAELDQAARAIFASHLSLAISPFVEIAEEVRVVLIDDVPLAVYAKARAADWRHNLDLGARPVLLPPGETRDTCVALAIQAAQAIGIRFASIDVVRTGDEWKVLEINSGVMMEALGAHHPELVYEAYSAALEKLFE
jgi:glutathione synthase/RimK-type ligase-like ATP-grasp enzyme